MNIDKVFARLAAAPHDEVELRRVARALGDELPRERPDVLRRFRAALARMPPVADSTEPTENNAQSYAHGYLASMLDIAAEYETHVHEREPDGARIREHVERAGQGAGRTALSEDMICGIRLAVCLLEYALGGDASGASTLDEVASQVLGDPRAATEAVDRWAVEAKSAGLIDDRAPAHEQPRANAIPLPVLATGSGPAAAVPTGGAPNLHSLASSLEERRGPVPARASSHEESTPWPRRWATARASAANDNEITALGADDLDATGVD